MAAPDADVALLDLRLADAIRSVHNGQPALSHAPTRQSEGHMGVSHPTAVELVQGLPTR